MMIAHEHVTRALVLVALLLGLTFSAAVMGWQTPLLLDQIVADE